jgi:putative cell wall-binding protein
MSDGQTNAGGTLRRVLKGLFASILVVSGATLGAIGVASVASATTSISVSVAATGQGAGSSESNTGTCSTSTTTCSVTSATFTPTSGASYLIFAAHTSATASNDAASLTSAALSNITPEPTLTNTSNPAGATAKTVPDVEWVWLATGTSTKAKATVDFAKKSKKATTNANPYNFIVVLKLSNVASTAIAAHVLTAAKTTAKKATVTLDAASTSKQLILFYMGADPSPGTPGWTNSVTGLLSGYHSGGPTTGDGVLVATAPAGTASTVIDSTGGGWPAGAGAGFGAIDVVLGKVTYATTTTLTVPAAFTAGTSENWTVTVSSSGHGHPTKASVVVETTTASHTVCTVTSGTETTSGSTAISGSCSGTLPAGNHTHLKAVYPATGTYATSTSTTHSVVVTGHATTTTLIVPATFITGTFESWTVSVSSTSNGHPAIATILVETGTTPICTVLPGTETTTGTTAITGTCSGTLTAGDHTHLKAVYPATGTFTTSTSSTQSLVVSGHPTTTTLTVPASFVGGTSESWTIKVATTGHGNPATATVVVETGTTPICTVSPGTETTTGTTAITGTCSGTLAPGDHTHLKAVYPATGTYTTSTSSTHSVTVTGFATTTTLTVPAPFVAGTAENWTVKVSSSSHGHPTKASVVVETTTAGHTVCTVTSGSETTTGSTAIHGTCSGTLTAGTHSHLKAVYPPTGTYAGSTSTTHSLTVSSSGGGGGGGGPSATVPGAPTLKTATPGTSLVHLVWTAPSSNGGATITKYEVCYSTTSAGVAACSSHKTVGNVTSTTVTGLTNGKKYFFAVKAHNSQGFGPLSNIKTATANLPPPAAPTRVAGTTADATAAAEFERAYPSTKGLCPTSRTAVLATTKAYQDALSSQFLAQSLTTGTLLTPTTTLAAVTAATLKAEGIATVDVVGGSLAISTTVVKALQKLTAFGCGGSTPAGKIAVLRIAGPTAEGTAMAIAEHVGTAASLAFAAAYAPGKYNDTVGKGSTAPAGSVPTAILASAKEFQDAETASVISYHTKLPLLLTGPTSLSATAFAAMTKLGIKQVILMGGPFAVSNTVEAAIAAKGISVLRIAGKDATDTARELARFETANAPAGLGWTPGHRIMVTRGNGFTDGIAGAVLDSPHNTATGPPGTVRPLLLTESPTTVGTYLTTFLKVTCHTGINGTKAKTVNALTILGGTLAVTTAVVVAMQTDLAH